MRNMAVLHSPAFSYPLPVLVRVLSNLLIFKGKILYYNKYSESRVEELRLEGIAQANRYADSDRVKNAVGTTQLHKIVVVYKGMEMRVCEEIVPLHETYN